MALAADDDLHVGQHHRLHHHLGAAQRRRPQTGQTSLRLLVYHFIYVRLQSADVRTGSSVFSYIMFVFLQGGTLNKTTKRSGQAERDSDREPLNPGEEEQNEAEAEEEDEGVRSRAINS